MADNDMNAGRENRENADDRQESAKNPQDMRDQGTQNEPLGAGHQQSADGGSVTFAGSSSTGPGAGQAGTDRSESFIGSQADESDPQQAGFDEQGQGAGDGESNLEGSEERNANRESDIEGSSNA